MPVWKLQTAVWRDSVMARDAFVITPHFNDSGATTDPQSLCDDLAAGIDGWLAAVGGHQITVKAYDAQGSTPVYPQGEATLNVGVANPSGAPREVACCLSFFSTRNIKRQRGRLYLPGLWLGGSLGVRPSSGQRTKLAELVPIFTGLGGVDVDWCVYSRVDNVARPVTDWWIDDEWDTVRSRGLRATTRTVGTTSEG